MKPTNFITTLVELSASFKVYVAEHNEKRDIRNTAMLLNNMSEWQKEDINFYGRDLSKYNQYLF